MGNSRAVADSRYLLKFRYSDVSFCEKVEATQKLEIKTKEKEEKKIDTLVTQIPMVC